jgi:hypothetical protein
MPDFEESRDQLRRASGEKEAAADVLHRAQQQLKQLAAAETELDRVFDPHNRQQLRERKRLRERKAEAKDELDRAGADLREKGSLVREFAGQFAGFSDPRQGIARLKDDIPILLLPVRLENGFTDGQAPTALLYLLLRLSGAMPRPPHETSRPVGSW